MPILRHRVPLPAAMLVALLPILATNAAQTQTPPAAPVKLAGKTCLTVDQATQEPNKDICLTAHVYSLIELADGTRFLDVCPPGLPVDREEVGDLSTYRDRDITLRGIVRPTSGRMGMVISHIRQFRGGPEKFRPNPKLLKDFNAQSNRPPVRDPNLSSGGGHRSFMNTSDQEPLPSAHKN